MTWRALYCSAGLELKARDVLVAMGHTVFCPYEREKRRVASRAAGTGGWRLVFVDTPVFLNYVFVDVDEDTSPDWVTEIGGLREVLDFVRCAGAPLAVPAAQLKDVMEVADERGMVSSADLTKNSYKFRAVAGDACSFGPGAGLEGVAGRIASVADLDKTGQVVVVVNLFGGEQEVKVDHRLLKNTPQPEQRAAA